MSNELTAGIVRVLDSAGGTGGTGFVVTDDGLIATCSHVVQSEESQRQGAPRPDYVDLVFHATSDRRRARVRPKCWRPADAEDVAVLRLTSPLPDGVAPLPLDVSVGSEGHAFITFGFPEPSPVEGLRGGGHILGETTLEGVRVLQVRSQEVAQGMSGAPLWDVEAKRIVGMVTSTYHTDATLKFRDLGFATPTEVLLEACPKLARAEVVPTQAVVDERSVLFDVGHDQKEWGRKWDSERPLLSHDYKPFGDIVRDLHLRPVEVTSLKEETLKPAPLLVLVLPFKARYSLDEVRSIKGFVRAGGGLLALSYYGGDEHFQTNLNEVLEASGITTASGRVIDGEASSKNPLKLTAYASPGNGLLPEGEKLFIPLCCSLTLDVGKNPSAKPIVQSSENTRAQTMKRIEGRVCDFLPKENNTKSNEGPYVLGAVAKYGMGRVAVLGSWGAFATMALTKEGYANSHLLEMLLKWLIREDTDAADRA